MDFTTLGKTPISEKNPCGDDVRYDPEFELVQAEIDKLSSPTASGQVDWDQVAEKSAVILKEKSKDLTVACYLSVALMSVRQIEGLDQGLYVLKGMIETHWDKLYPIKRRMRGRVAAIQWWLERAETELQKINPAPLAAETAERIKSNLKSIDAFIAENMPEAPVLRSLQRLVDAFPVQKTEAPPEKAAAGATDAAPATAAATRKPAAAVKSTAAPTPSADDAMGGAIGDDAEARRAADAAFQRLRQVSAYLIQKDLRNPLPYRYRRIAGWAKVAALPAQTDGNTQLTPPAPQVVDALEALRAEGNLEAFVQNAEQKQSQFIFWFDLNRFVAEALNDLGKDYQKAMAVVCQETAGFMQRMPGLEALRFSDGTPFADPQTKKWLKSIGSSGNGGTGMPAAVNAGRDDENRLSTIVQKARAMARKKNLVEAVTTLQNEMQQTSSHCQKMRWRLAIARLLLDMKKTQLALPHLEQIVADIDEFKLEIWDPELAMEGLSAAWQGFNAQAANEHKARAAELLHRIAKVDPAAALQMA